MPLFCFQFLSCVKKLWQLKVFDSVFLTVQKNLEFFSNFPFHVKAEDILSSNLFKFLGYIKMFRRYKQNKFKYFLQCRKRSNRNFSNFSCFLQKNIVKQKLFKIN